MDNFIFHEMLSLTKDSFFVKTFQSIFEKRSRGIEIHILESLKQRSRCRSCEASFRSPVDNQFEIKHKGVFVPMLLK